MFGSFLIEEKKRVLPLVMAMVSALIIRELVLR